MTINDRVKEIRKELGLTQMEFGERVGISQGHLTAIENGIRNVTEKSIKVICLEFGICEEWLRTGEGTMRSETADCVMDELAKRYNLDETEQLIASICLRMPPDQRRAVMNFVVSVAEALGDPANAAASEVNVSELNNKLNELGAPDHAAAPSTKKKSPAK